jgi:large subunit ribosomal protein L22
MEIKASLNHLRMSPRKVRLVIDLVRKMPVEKAIAQLKFSGKKAALPVIKLIESGIANASDLYSIDKSNLLVKEIRSDEGLTLKRWMPKAHGRATLLRKRGSHISLVLAEITEGGKREKKAAPKADAPIKLSDLAKEAEKKGAKKDEAKAENKEVKAKTNKGGEVSGSKGFATKVFRRKAG